VEKATDKGEEGGRSNSLGDATVRVEEDAWKKEVAEHREGSRAVEVPCALACVRRGEREVDGDRQLE
jgi:hypothetical protein